MRNGKAATSSRAVKRAAVELRRHLGRGEFRAGSRLPALPELARRLDCGQTNLHRAMRQLAREGLLTARRGAGTYVTSKASRLDGAAGTVDLPSAHANSRINPHTHSWTCGTTGTTVRDPITAGAMDELRDELMACGATVRHVPLDDVMGDASKPPAPLDLPGDAVIVVNVRMDWPLKLRDGERQVLGVVATRAIQIERASRYDVVTVDHEQGGYLVAQHLKRCGVASVCYIGANPRERISSRRFDFTSQLRLRGFELAWGERLKPEHLLYRLLQAPEAGSAAVPGFLQLSPRPQAIVCATDELARGFIHGAYAHGLEAGRDYQLISCGDGTLTTEIARHTLTTVRFPLAKMCRLAARMVSERMADPDQSVRRVSVGGELVEGDTCKRISRRANLSS
jgi:hypothetical protein